MWGLYTQALANAPSAIQANIVNTAVNFVVAALLGLAIFGESLPPLWWVGASLLVAGTVLIGRRSEDKKAKED
jgi:drug/metabolite transporter (DMT)-like permease